MDNRIALTEAAVLPFPSMPVTVERELGRGSNAIVYVGTYPDRQSGASHRVLVKELFPLHPEGGVFRDTDGSIRREGAEEFFEFHRESFVSGNRVHLELLEHAPDGMGGNINTFPLHGTLYTLLGYHGGRTLEEELDARTHTPEEIVRTLKGLLHALNDFHRNGFLHLDVAPDNVMLLGTGARERVVLIDYNSVMKLHSEQTHFSVKQGYSSPEVQAGDVAAFSEGSDLYSVTALLLRWIRGYALLPFEAAQRTPPSISDCRLLEGLPQTALSMLRRILYRGLAPSPARRYRSIREMLTDLDELEDRIRGVGITHWALWEAGKKTVDALIKSNTALAYLKRPESLFPISVEEKDGTRTPISEEIERLKAGGAHLFVTAPGGMGKTTSMLAALQSSSAGYSPNSPAIVYVPLHGISAGADSVTDRILEHLQFKSDVRSYEEARHALRRLLDSPLSAQDSVRPVLLLFLDGLNEAREGREQLLEEIAALSALAGVRIYLTSRTEVALQGFSYRRLAPLSREEVDEILAKAGLLRPASAEMQALLQTPILLSMFLTLSAERGTQPTAGTAEELLDAYVASLIEKETATLPEDSPLRIKLDVAVHLVLPRVTAYILRTGAPASEESLLREVRACYRLIRSPLLIRAYPQWIARRRAACAGCDNAEDWYGELVCELLWRRLGMLIRTSDGKFLPVHQTVGEHLAARHEIAQKRITRYRAVRSTLVSLLALLLAAATVTAGVLLYPRAEPPRPSYRREMAVQVLTDGAIAYQLAGYQYVYLRELTDAAQASPSDLRDALLRYQFLTSCNLAPATLPTLEEKQVYVDALLESGDVFSATGEPLETEEYLMLIEQIRTHSEEYAALTEALAVLTSSPHTAERYGEEYLALLSELVETDAAITATLYAIACRAPVNALIDEMYQSGDSASVAAAKSLSHALTASPAQNAHLPEESDPTLLGDRLKTLRGTREELYARLQANGVYITYLTQRETAS